MRTGYWKGCACAPLLLYVILTASGAQSGCQHLDVSKLVPIWLGFPLMCDLVTISTVPMAVVLVAQCVKIGGEVCRPPLRDGFVAYGMAILQSLKKSCRRKFAHT